MQKSLKIVIAAFILFVILLVGGKQLLKRNTWIYLKVATQNDKERLVERQWLNLDSRWYSKSSNDSAFFATNIDDKKWATERFLYIALVKGGKESKWLRKHFIVKEKPPIDTLMLRLSLFDTHVKVWVNGTKIADSGFVYNSSICYKLASNLLLVGKSNIIAIQANITMANTESVTKFRDEIIVPLTPEISLEGSWKIAKGDNFSWKDQSFNDSAFSNIVVPGTWKSKELKDYDGIAWYRKKFTVPAEYRKKELVLVAGMIDDFNEIYINGTKIGGNVFKKYNQRQADDWASWVIYKFDGALLNDSNTIAIRVNDFTLDGGIYKGPVGILTLDNYYQFFK